MGVAAGDDGDHLICKVPVTGGLARTLPSERRCRRRRFTRRCTLRHRLCRTLVRSARLDNHAAAATAVARSQTTRLKEHDDLCAASEVAWRDPCGAVRVTRTWRARCAVARGMTDGSAAHWQIYFYSGSAAASPSRVSNSSCAGSSACASGLASASWLCRSNLAGCVAVWICLSLRMLTWV